jgi:uncharacterized membrane protein YphA (DoxX/SURF4 family)
MTEAKNIAQPVRQDNGALPRRRPILNVTLWIIQVLLAAFFLFAGGMKLAISPEELMKMGPPNQVRLPGLFLQFIGVCEVLGALGLILPGLFRIKPGLTPLAAAGLLIIMIGATVLTIAGPGFAMALTPLVTGLVAAFVAYGRWRLAPHRSR